MSVDLVVLGNLLLDDVVLPDGRTRMAEPGGAALYAALGARLWGVRVGMVSVRGDEYPADALDLMARRGVALDGVRPLGRPGLRTWLLYEGARRHLVHRLEGPTHAEVSPSPDTIPPEWREARAFHLCPMPIEVQAALVEALPGRFLSLDPFLLLRPDTLEAWRGLLARVNALFLSEDEMELPEVEDLRELATGRLATIVFKRGARGGTLFTSGGGPLIVDPPPYPFDTSECVGAGHGSTDRAAFRCIAPRVLTWEPRAAEVVDPTGAGDAFAAGVLAGWLRGEPHERALQRGIVGASFAIEDWGPAGIFRATPDAAEARLRAWFE
jgi:sugar/nucleoside kinase (ribokinase family)